ncbi:hypothetical protein B0H14DRAFT_3688197 [Mycena olivaceomarginata]|nr:hypothetical protein B0H14DRAFT_3688197 [Mycena olivaceomarginata]
MVQELQVALAVELDTQRLDEDDINILEAMLMAKKTWEEVSAEAIQHCWKHSGIIPPPPKTTDPNASTHDKAWELVGAYAEDSMKRPVVEEALQALLGDQFHPASIWAMTLNQLTECDSTEEVDAVMTKAKADFEAGLQSPPPSRPAQAPRTKQLAIAETELMATIADLHRANDLVDLEDERDVGNAQFKVQTDAEIVAAVRSKQRLPEAM